MLIYLVINNNLLTINFLNKISCSYLLTVYLFHIDLTELTRVNIPH